MIVDCKHYHTLTLKHYSTLPDDTTAVVGLIQLTDFEQIKHHKRQKNNSNNDSLENVAQRYSYKIFQRKTTTINYSVMRFSMILLLRLAKQKGQNVIV